MALLPLTCAWYAQMPCGDVLVSKKEGDRVALELAALEEEAARVREIVAAQRAAASVKPKPEAGLRWRGTGGEEDDPPACTSEKGLKPHRQEGAVFAEAPRRAAREVSVTPRATPIVKKAPARRPGEWHGVAAFLEDIGLGSYGYEAILVESGFDSPDAIAALDDARVRRLGIITRHAMKLKVGIAELRAFAAAPALPSKESAAARGASGLRAASPAQRTVFGKEARGRPPAPPASSRATSERREPDRCEPSNETQSAGRSRQPRAASVPRAVSVGLAAAAHRGSSLQVPRPPSVGRRRPTSADRARQQGHPADPSIAVAAARRGRGPVSPDERPLLTASCERPRLERRPSGLRA